MCVVAIVTNQCVVDWLEKISRNSLNQFPAKIKCFADSVSSISFTTIYIKHD